MRCCGFDVGPRWFVCALVFLLHALARVICWIYFIFIGPCAGRRFLVCSRLGVPTACASADFMCDIFFIFFDPCAGRHLLFFAAPKKVSKERRFAPPTLSVHLQRDNGVVRKAPRHANLHAWLTPIVPARGLCGLCHQGSRSGEFFGEARRLSDPGPFTELLF